MKHILIPLAVVVALAGAVLGVMGWRAQALLEPVAPAGAGAPLPAPPPFDAPAAAARLAAAIRFPTISLHPGQIENPQAFADLRAFLAASYPKAHAALRREIVADHTLMYTWPGSDPALAPVLLMAHQDVVPVEAGTEAAWAAPPFSGAIQDGFVYGRGALDDKGALIAILEAAEALAAAGFRPKRTLLFVFGHDEEVLGAGAQAAATALKQAGVRPWFVLDEGMVVIADFPLTKAPVALIGVAEKGYMTVRVTARGAGGHSSTPPRDTAIERLARAVLAIRAAPFPGGLEGGPAGAMLSALGPHLGFTERFALANRWALEGVLERATGASPEGDALLRTTIAPTLLNAGAKENVLAQEAHAILNLRLHPRDTAERALAHVRAAAAAPGVTVTLEGAPIEASPVADTDGTAYALLAAAARGSAPPGTPAAPMLVLGATDSRHFAGLAQNVYRFSPTVLAQQDLARIHGDDERLSIDNLARMIGFYAQLMAAAAG